MVTKIGIAVTFEARGFSIKETRKIKGLKSGEERIN